MYPVQGKCVVSRVGKLGRHIKQNPQEKGQEEDA